MFNIIYVQKICRYVPKRLFLKIVPALRRRKCSLIVLIADNSRVLNENKYSPNYRTGIRHNRGPDNSVLDNSVPDNSVPENSVPGQFGPGQSGTRTIRARTIWSRSDHNSKNKDRKNLKFDSSFYSTDSESYM